MSTLGISADFSIVLGIFPGTLREFARVISLYACGDELQAACLDRQWTLEHEGAGSAAAGTRSGFVTSPKGLWPCRTFHASNTRVCVSGGNGLRWAV